MEYNLGTDKGWWLSRMQFAARTVANWQEQFPDAAERMVRETVLLFGNEETRAAFNTAFGR